MSITLTQNPDGKHTVWDTDCEHEGRCGICGVKLEHDDDSNGWCSPECGRVATIAAIDEHFRKKEEKLASLRETFKLNVVANESEDDIPF